MSVVTGIGFTCIAGMPQGSVRNIGCERRNYDLHIANDANARAPHLRSCMKSNAVFIGSYARDPRLASLLPVVECGSPLPVRAGVRRGIFQRFRAITTCAPSLKTETRLCARSSTITARTILRRAWPRRWHHRGDGFRSRPRQSTAAAGKCTDLRKQYIEPGRVTRASPAWLCVPVHRDVFAPDHRGCRARCDLNRSATDNQQSAATSGDQQ